MTLAVVPYVGDYKKSAAAQIALIQELKDAGLRVKEAAGIYFDNPKEVESDKLRSLVGAVLQDDELEKFRSLNSKAKLVKLHKESAFYTKWDYKSGLSMMLAIMKIYPAIKKHAKLVGFDVHESIETYEFANKQLNYYFPKQSMEKLWETADSK
jgi:hypothetical protein